VTVADPSFVSPWRTTEMGELDAVAKRLPDPLEVRHVLDLVHLADPVGVDLRDPELREAVLRQLGVVPDIEECLVHVALEAQRLIGDVGIDRHQIVELAVDDPSVGTASDDAAADVLVDRRL
jgi:hypothetical protein